VSDSPAAASRERGVGEVPWWEEIPARTGSLFMNLVKAGALLWSILVRTNYYALRGRIAWRDVLLQAFEFGWRSIFFLTVTMGFVAMLFVYQAAYQIDKVTGDLQLVGATYIELVVHDLYASTGAVILATRIGAGMAAEIGSMVVTEQVDAIRMCGSDPVEYLVTPRYVASIIGGTAVLMYTCAVMIFAGMFTAYYYFGVNPRIYWNLSLVEWHEVMIGIVKTVIYCAAIPVVSSYCGLTTFGGSRGVGWATTRAVVNSALAIILLDAFISLADYFIFY
jgi:phospholipid/cholesterol/gamma-HCH transport system permease protein